MKTYILIIFFILWFGCGKKQPIGYDLIKPREGKICIAKGSVEAIALEHKFNYIDKPIKLFAGKEKDFDAIAFVYFKFETLVTPETLFIVGKDTGTLIIGIIDSVNFDSSLNWSKKPQIKPFTTVELKDTTKIPIPDTSAYSFYFAFYSDEELLSFCSQFDEKKQRRRPYIKIKGDTILKGTSNLTYIDTSIFSLPLDSLSYIELGAYLTICTLYTNLRLYKDDTAFITIDSITDSIIKAFKLDSVKINEAKFIALIDTINSYEWKEATVCAKYKDVKSALSIVRNDTLNLDIESVVRKWFNEPGKLYFTIEGADDDISRIIFNWKRAKISITYTHPPKPRE